MGQRHPRPLKVHYRLAIGIHLDVQMSSPRAPGISYVNVELSFLGTAHLTAFSDQRCLSLENVIGVCPCQAQDNRG